VRRPRPRARQRRRRSPASSDRWIEPMPSRASRSASGTARPRGASRRTRS